MHREKALQLRLMVLLVCTHKKKCAIPTATGFDRQSSLTATFGPDWSGLIPGHTRGTFRGNRYRPTAPATYAATLRGSTGRLERTS